MSDRHGWSVVINNDKTLAFKVDESRKEASSLLGGSVGCLSEGPNTSTPADELEGNSSSRFSQSTHFL